MTCRSKNSLRSPCPLSVISCFKMAAYRKCQSKCNPFSHQRGVQTSTYNKPNNNRPLDNIRFSFMAPTALVSEVIFFHNVKIILLYTKTKKYINKSCVNVYFPEVDRNPSEKNESLDETSSSCDTE